MINNALDLAYWRSRLEKDGRVQIEHYLQLSAAERLHSCLALEVPWTLALRDINGPRTVSHADYSAMEPAEFAKLLASTAEHAARSDVAFGFAYDSYMMVTAYKEGRDPHLLLNRLLELLNSPDYIQFMRELTGDARVRRVSAQASRYRPGHFLRCHDDFNAEEGRLYAYVINLSRDWQADWGGLLQFIGEDGRVIDTYVPRWNTLSLFAVPAAHAVSLVAPWARQDRLAITGWLMR